MILNEREIKILEQFYYNNEMKISELSKLFGISERMIRYNIDRLNTVLKFLKVSTIKKISKGTMALNVEKNSDKILEIIKKLEPLDKNKKIVLILFLIIFSNKDINISELTNYFNVSRTTIINYLKEIQTNLNKFNLKIENDKKLFLKGNLEDIVKYKQVLLFENMKYIEKDDSTEISLKIKEIIFELVDRKLLKKIKALINEIMNDLNFSISDNNFRNFFSKIIYILLDDNIEKKEVIHLKEYEYIKDKCDKLKILKLLSNDKVIEISNLIFLLKTYDKYIDENDWLNVEILAKNIISNVEANINVNISKDKLLFEFLTQHLQALIHRVKLGYKFEKSILEKSDKLEDEMYFYVKEAIKIINKVLGKDLSEDEVHLIRMHFLASIERIKKIELKPIDIIIVSSLGDGSNRILVDNIQNKFYVKIKAIIPKFKLKNYLKKYNDIKYILTTIDIEDKDYKDKNIVKISPIISEEDKRKLEELGFRNNTKKVMLSNVISVIKKNTSKLNEENLIEDLMLNFGDKFINDINIAYNNEVLVNENIVFDYNAKNIEDAITKSCKILENKYIDESYTNEVLSIFKENNFNIIRYNGIILPHTKNKNNVYMSGVSIITLKNPVIIQETNEYIDTVVTFVIENEKKSLDTISRIINLIFKEKFKDILKLKDKEKIIKYLEE